MKKLIFSALVATALCFSSCGKDDDNGGGSTSLKGDWYQYAIYNNLDGYGFRWITPHNCAQKTYWSISDKKIKHEWYHSEGSECKHTPRYYDYTATNGVFNMTVADDSPYGNALRMLHHKMVPGIEMGTFDAGSFNWGIPGGIFSNSPTFLTTLGNLYQERDIKPEFEVFDLGMIRAVGVYWKKGIVKAPLHFQLCLGVVGGMNAECADVEEMLAYIRRLQLYGELPMEITWSAFGVGKGHIPVMLSTLANGGNIRVGMEDNVIYGKDEKGEKIFATNKMLVERAVRIAKAADKKIATPAEARKILGLKEFNREEQLNELRAIKVEDFEAAKAGLREEFGGTYFEAKGMG